jgi:hypothetical protein
MNPCCNLAYHKREDSFDVDTNIPSQSVAGFIGDVLRRLAIEPEESRKPARRRVYHINISCDASYKNVRVTSDTKDERTTSTLILRAVDSGAFEPSKIERLTPGPNLVAATLQHKTKSGRSRTGVHHQSIDT